MNILVKESETNELTIINKKNTHRKTKRFEEHIYIIKIYNKMKKDILDLRLIRSMKY